MQDMEMGIAESKVAKWPFWAGALSVSVLGIFVLAVYPLPRWILSRSAADWLQVRAIERYELEAALRASLIQGIAALLLVLGGITAIRQLAVARDQAKLAHRAQYVEAFTGAVDQLSRPNSATRVAGVYALDRLADDNANDGIRISDILARFVQEEGRHSLSAAAVEASLRILSKRNSEALLIDLHGAYLAGRNLSALNLAGANLRHCDLRGADLSKTDLRRADLTAVDLTGAVLNGATLTNAIMDETRINSIVTDSDTQM